jgi:DNA-binding transcriptional LysR family regulator
MNITPCDLHYFLAIAKHKQLVKAAEICNVTQPALTKAVHRLEAECGLKLLKRDGRGIQLTEEGARFKTVAESLYKTYQDAKRTAADIRAQESGLLRLGTTDASPSSLVASTLSMLLRQRPGLRATLKFGRSDQLASAVLEGQLDVAIVPVHGAPPAGCDSIRVGEDPHLPVMSVRHPLAARFVLTPAELMPYGWIQGGQHSAAFQDLSALFARYELPAPTLAVEVDYATEAMLSLLRASDMLSLIPRSLFRGANQHDLFLVPIPDFRIDQTVLCLTRSGAEKSPLTKAFCDLLIAQTEVLGK